jgi:hypothetical protein
MGLYSNRSDLERAIELKLPKVVIIDLFSKYSESYDFKDKTEEQEIKHKEVLDTYSKYIKEVKNGDKK